MIIFANSKRQFGIFVNTLFRKINESSQICTFVNQQTYFEHVCTSKTRYIQNWVFHLILTLPTPVRYNFFFFFRFSCFSYTRLKIIFSSYLIGLVTSYYFVGQAK